jgi:type IV pilus assembly protein PilC
MKKRSSTSSAPGAEFSAAARRMAAQSEPSARVYKTPGAGAIRARELPTFARAMHAMLDAGMPLAQCLNSAEQQTASIAFRQVLERIRMAVQHGNRFSAAAAQFPDVFDDMFLGMIRTGEVSGRLAETLGSLADHLESSAELRQKVKAAMMYPAAVTAFAVLLTSGILIWIVPAFERIYDDLGGALPVPTRMLITLSRLLRHYFVYLAAAVALAVIAFKLVLRTKRGRHAWDRAILWMPVFGDLALKVSLARFTESFSQMLRNGIPILRALELAGEVMGNTALRQGILRCRERVEHGEQLAAAMRTEPLYPSMMVQMVATGEKTGKIDDMMERVAVFYRNEVNVMLRSLTALVEPMLIMVLGVLVGGVVVCMFIPIFKLHELVKF